MTSSPRREKQAAILVLAFCIFLAAIIRLQLLLATPRPLNDGGLFLAMTRDLQAAGYRLPEFTTYNLPDRIPYAYPPLSFALAGALNQLLGADLLQVLRWLPFVLNMLSILPFYLLAKRILGDGRKPLYATIAYSLLKPGYFWYIMGGGLTRSLGLLCSLWALVFFWDALRAGRWFSGRLLAAGVLLGLTACSHIEITLLTAGVMALFCCFQGGFRRSVLRLAGVGVLGVLVSAPYWGQVLHFHGLAPFLAASGTGGIFSESIVIRLLAENLMEEEYLTLFYVLFLIGLGGLLLQKKILLPGWMLVILLVGYRSLERSSVIPLAMVVAVALDDILVPGFESILSKLQAEGKPARLRYPLALIVPFLVFTQAFGSALLDTMQNGNQFILPETSAAAMQWVEQNTPPDASFVLLPGAEGWFQDPVLEWFPVLAQRYSWSTVQGYEWVRGAFDAREKQYLDLFESVWQDDPQKFQLCLPRAGDSYDYILFNFNFSYLKLGPRLDAWLNRGHSIVYQQDGIVIYARHSP